MTVQIMEGNYYTQTENIGFVGNQQAMLVRGYGDQSAMVAYFTSSETLIAGTGNTYGNFSIEGLQADRQISSVTMAPAGGWGWPGIVVDPVGRGTTNSNGTMTVTALGRLGAVAGTLSYQQGFGSNMVTALATDPDLITELRLSSTALFNPYQVRVRFATLSLPRVAILTGA